jgi:dimeric dUTPase (all-alpha-NTP-PPase superfamily)
MMIKANVLSLHDAFRLYKLIDPVFPEYSDDTETITFLKSLVDNIENTDSEITEQILILFDEDVDFMSITGLDSFLILYAGFESNRIISLVEFFRMICNG